MTDTRRLSVEISESQGRFVDALIAGGYESVEAVISDALSRLAADDPLSSEEEGSPDFQAFLTECDETDRLIEAGLEPTHTVQEVRAHFEARRTELLGGVRTQAAE